MENKLFVLYDEECALCAEIARRLNQEVPVTPIETLPMRSAVTEDRFRRIAPLVAAGRFVVVADNGAVYLDFNGRVRVLYALRRFRKFAHLLSVPVAGAMAALILESLSSSRGFLSLLAPGMRRTGSSACTNNRCGGIW